MPIIQAIKDAAALILSLVLGFAGLYKMFTAEMATGQHHDFYFQWALGAGLVFVAVGVALTIFDRDDRVLTQYDDEKGK